MLAPRKANIVPYRYGFDAVEPTYAVGRFYKDSAFDYGKSPTAPTVSPMLKANIQVPTYSAKTLAANNLVFDGKGSPQKVAWVKPIGANESDRVAMIQVDNKPVPLEGDALDMIRQWGNKPVYERQPDGSFKNVAPVVYPEDLSTLPDVRETQNLGQELAEVNREMAKGAKANPYDPYTPPASFEKYTGDPDEHGLEAFQKPVLIGMDSLGEPIFKYVHRGNSPSWANDKYGDDINFFAANKVSDSQSKVALDFARGGVKKSGGGITPAYPAVEETDFVGDRVGYDTRGNLIDVRPQRILLEKSGPTLPGRQGLYDVIDNGLPVNPAVNAFTPASEFLEPAAQWKVDPNSANRTLVRFPTYEQTSLAPVQTNEYGLVVAQPLKSGRIARSIKISDGFPVDNRKKLFLPTGEPTLNYGKQQQLYSYVNNPGYGKAETDLGGRPLDVRRDDYVAPLDAYYKIRGEYRPMLSPADKRVFDALLKDQQARAAAAATPEEKFIPFNREYTLTQTGREIQPQFEEKVIPGAFMPVTYADGRRGYEPYIPSKADAARNIGDGLSMLDQHLANVVVEIDGRKYPLTPEATTEPYLKSEKQIADDANSRFGKVRINQGGDWEDVTGPTQAELDEIVRKGNLNFDPAEDIRQARANGVGLSDGSEIYANPNIAPRDINEAIAEKERELARIKAGINNYYTSESARIPNSSANVINSGDNPYTNRYVSGDNIGQVVKVTDKDGNVSYRPANSFVKTTRNANGELVEDMSHVSKRDLGNIFGEYENSIPLPSYLEAEIARAKAATNQLMNLEAQPEIQISTNTSTRKANTLAEQAKQLGMEVVGDPQDSILVTGSIPFGSSLDLPVRRNAVPQEVDREIAEMYRLGKLDQLNKARGGKVIYPDGQTPVIVPEQQRNIQQLSNFEIIDSPGTTITLPDGTTKLVPGTRQVIDKRPPAGKGADYGYYFTPTRKVQSGRRAITGDSYQPDWSQAYIANPPVIMTPEEQQRANEAIASIAPWSQSQVPMLVSPSADTYVANKIAEEVSQPTPITAADTAAMQFISDYGQPAKVKVLPRIRRQQQVESIRDRGMRYNQSPGEGSLDMLIARRGIGDTNYPLARAAQQLDMPIDNNTYDYVVNKPVMVSDNIAAPVVVEPMQEPQYLTIDDIMPQRRYAAQEMMANALQSRGGAMVSNRQPVVVEDFPPRARRTNQQEVFDNGVFVPPYTPSASPTSPSLPNWAIPAGLGGIYLGAAGVNAWQQEQERKRMEEESQLRRMYAGY